MYAYLSAEQFSSVLAGPINPAFRYTFYTVLYVVKKTIISIKKYHMKKISFVHKLRIFRRNVVAL
jgi:hypothetical protein